MNFCEFYENSYNLNYMYLKYFFKNCKKSIISLIWYVETHILNIDEKYNYILGKIKLLLAILYKIMVIIHKSSLEILKIVIEPFNGSTRLTKKLHKILWKLEYTLFTNYIGLSHCLIHFNLNIDVCIPKVFSSSCTPLLCT
jgi:hypothetical protein